MSGETVLIVDDNARQRNSLCALLESAGYDVIGFASPAESLARGEWPVSCLILDMRMPGMTGIELYRRMKERGVALPVIFITGHNDVPVVVKAMQEGAIDFLEKPYEEHILLSSLKRAIELSNRWNETWAEAKKAGAAIAKLTPRERDVLDQLVIGRSMKLAANELRISPRTVEVHRAHIKTKLGARCLSDMVRIAIAAARPAAEGLPRHLNRDPAVPKRMGR